MKICEENLTALYIKPDPKSVLYLYFGKCPYMPSLNFSMYSLWSTDRGSGVPLLSCRKVFFTRPVKKLRKLTWLQSLNLPILHLRIKWDVKFQNYVNVCYLISYKLHNIYQWHLTLPISCVTVTILRTTRSPIRTTWP